MPIQLLVHIAGEDSIVLDVDELPSTTDQVLIGTNPRYRDNKPVRNILAEVNTVIFPWWRINLIEILPSGEDEEVYGFFRE